MAGHDRGRPGATVGQRTIGLGVHQAVEFLLGVFLVVTSTRVTDAGAGVVLGLGATLLVLPVVTAGPLAAFPILPAAAHRLADVALVMLAVTSPLLPVDVEGDAVPVVVLAGFGLALLTRATSYTRARRHRAAPHTGHNRRAAPPASTWARSLGASTARARGQLPRQAGRVVGRLRRRGPGRP